MILQTHELTKRYGDYFALNEVSISVKQGDIYGLVGRNGAGKTTLFKCLMGLVKPTSGTIDINGETTNLNDARREMGFMITPSFFNYLSAEENLTYLCRVKGMKEKGKMDWLLNIVGLAGVKKPFKEFSLGMKQRLGLAAALLSSPSIVVLDEPINGLDPQGIREIRTLIKDVHQETGATFLISSHILTELDLVATRFGFIDQGNLLKEISHDELHKEMEDALIIKVDNVQKTEDIFQSMGVNISEIHGNELTLNTNFKQPNTLIRVLVENDIELYDFHRQETTLEDYYLRLLGGQQHV